MATPALIAGGSDSDNVLAAANLTLPYVCPAGTNRLLVAWVAFNGSHPGSSCTFGGNAMTLVVDANRPGTPMRVHIYTRLLGTGSGESGDIVFTPPATSDYIMLWVETVQYVNQAAPLGTSVIAETGSSPSQSCNVSAAVGDLVIDAITSFRGAVITVTPGVGQTLIGELADLTTGNVKLDASYKAAASTTVAMSYTFSLNAESGMIGVALKADSTIIGGANLPAIAHHLRQQGIS